MPGSLTREFEYKLEERLDVHLVVITAQNLLRLCRPFFAVHSVVRTVVDWRIPFLSTALLITLNSWCLLLPQAFSILAVVGFVGAFAVIGLCHRQYNLLSKILPAGNSDACFLDDDDSNDGHQERLREFRLLIILFHSFVKGACQCLDHFYSIVKWEHLNYSIKCHAGAGLAGLCLCLLPLRFNVVLFVNIFILQRPLTLGLQSLRERDERKQADHRTESKPVSGSKLISEDTISQTSEVHVDPGVGIDSDCSDNEKMLDDSTSVKELDVTTVRDHPLGQSVNIETDCLQSVNQKPTGVVNKLLEVKRRRQQSAVISEKCSACGVVFTAILKRKHVCNYCGNHFCSRCCSHKVPRSTFGATAPAAQTETVAVCLNCFNLLVTSSSKSKIN